MVNQVINLAKLTDVKNKIINSPKAAVIDVMKDVEENQTGAPNKNGIIAFTLPEENRRNKDLQDCRVETATGKNNTFLLVRILMAG